MQRVEFRFGESCALQNRANSTKRQVQHLQHPTGESGVGYLVHSHRLESLVSGEQTKEFGEQTKESGIQTKESVEQTK